MNVLRKFSGDLHSYSLWNLQPRFSVCHDGGHVSRPHTGGKSTKCSVGARVAIASNYYFVGRCIPLENNLMADPVSVFIEIHAVTAGKLPHKRLNVWHFFRR